MHGRFLFFFCTDQWWTFATILPIFHVSVWPFRFEPTKSMATPTRKSHTEVSFMEQLIIFRAYTKSRCNWSLVLDEVKRQRDKLPQAAMELYASTEGQKLKRRMADQVRKLTKDGMTICNPELKRLVEEVRAMDSRYSQKSDPASKRANLKRVC